jgi:hypothetical protein
MAEVRCERPGCRRPSYCRGLCRGHYQDYREANGIVPRPKAPPAKAGPALARHPGQLLTTDEDLAELCRRRALFADALARYGRTEVLAGATDGPGEG